MCANTEHHKLKNTKRKIRLKTQSKEKHNRVQISSERALDVEKTIHFDTAGVNILNRHLLHISQGQVPSIQATNK